MDMSTAHLMSWSENSKGDVPPPLTGPSMTISPLSAPHAPTVFMFGGKYVHNRRLTDEMWAMDIKTKTWSRVDAGRGPVPRYFHSMDVWEDKLVCFGGMSDADPISVHNDIWFFDCATRRWLPPIHASLGLVEGDQDSASVPSARYAHLSAVSRGKLIVTGGQHSDNSWIYEINVYDLRLRRWFSKTMQPELQGLHSKGAYRSVASSSKHRVIVPKPGDMKSTSAQTYSIREEGEGGEIWCYSNYDFAKVRRELDLFSPADEVDDAHPVSDKYASPPSIVVSDRSAGMRGSSSSQPPGLRFPTGGIVGNHFILCGLYLASSSAAFSIWALDLSTMVWRHLDSTVLATGSWNRAILWPERAKILVFGNPEYDLASDYGRRAVNLDNVAIVNLETWGIYQPPALEMPPKIAANSLSAFEGEFASDFDIVCDDQRKIKCSRALLRERWAWFREQEQILAERLEGATEHVPKSVDIADTLFGNFTPARLAPTHLTIPEPFPVCVALVQYFYTLSLSTPLQNRAPVLSALLFLGKQYKIERLVMLVVHALHERLEPNIATGIYEIATLAGEQNLQVRALQMIHSAKAGQGIRGQKQPPGTAHLNEGRANSPAPGQTAGSGPSQPSSGTTNGPTNGNDTSGPGGETGNNRQARVESMTLVDEVAEQVDSLLAALTVSPEEACFAPSPTEARSHSPTPASFPAPPPISARSIKRAPPTLAPAPSIRAFRSTTASSQTTPDLDHTRSSSPTFSEATSAYPSTPAESVRESSLFPMDTYTFDSRSSSGSSHGHGAVPYGSMGLPPLPEDQSALNKFRMVNGSMSSQNSLNSHFTSHQWPSSENQKEKERVKQSTLESAGLLSSRSPPTSLSSYQAQAIASQKYPPSLNDPFSRYTPSTHTAKAPKHFSVATTASSTSDYSRSSSRQETRQMVPPSPGGTEYSLVLDDQGSTRQGFHPSLMTVSSRSMETASILTTSSGNSNKKAEKQDKKAREQAAKLAKKAEAQAKFEALRSEQMQKMAIAKAEVQRRAEIAKYEEAKAADAKALEKEKKGKSKFGRLGAKFSDAVLFPAGGSNSTMF